MGHLEAAVQRSKVQFPELIQFPELRTTGVVVCWSSRYPHLFGAKRQAAPGRHTAGQRSIAIDPGSTGKVTEQHPDPPENMQNI